MTLCCPTCGQPAPPANDGARVAALCDGKHVTPRQRDVLACVVRHLREDGIAPTYWAIGRELGISKVVVSEHVHALVRAGVVRLAKHKARSLELVG